MLACSDIDPFLVTYGKVEIPAARAIFSSPSLKRGGGENGGSAELAWLIWKLSITCKAGEPMQADDPQGIPTIVPIAYMIKYRGFSGSGRYWIEETFCLKHVLVGCRHFPC